MAAFLVVLAVLAYLVHGASDGASVSVMEGDSVTLNIDLEIHQNDRIKWYFNDMRIAQITVNQSKLCTDDKCKERFTDRLKLDERTGDLTITNITTADSGHYQIKSNRKGIGEKPFIVTVRGVPAAERNSVKRKSVKEGEYVTLDPGVEKNPNDEMMWCFNNTTVTFTGCTDDQCNERFGDRLKLDHQTGSLTIMNTRTTDSGDYTLKITNQKHCDGRCTVVREMDFYVDVAGSGRSAVFRAVIFVCVLMAFLTAVGLICYRYRIYGNDNKRNTKEELLGEDTDA